MLPTDRTVPGDPTAGYYDAYRYKDARLSLYASISVTPQKQTIENIPLEYVTPPIPGLGPAPGTTGASGASGASGATGKSNKQKKTNKKSKKGT